ncbi:MAG: PQQ-binding-like beta-propeller repeat protein [Gemmataceae bacterium]|nr:PQQ-binding-like beta-propeller repeat protein [Gemmata sp.]MDW8197403.1 PQQ-binding-like beta-propeller repeat protein [Gemmataceae bacterium]
MPGIKFRLLSCVFLGLLVGWAVSSGTPVIGKQQVVLPGKPIPPDQPPSKDDKEDRSELDASLPFAPPYERDHKRRLEAVRDYLNVQDPNNIKWGDVCNFLQLILDSKSDSFFDVKYKVGTKVLLNRISVKTEANRIIGSFPPEGLQFYQQLQGQNAANLLDDAIKANYDLAMLSDLSQRYFHTKAGAQGTILLATIYLERGNYLEAAYAFERLLPRTDIADLFTPLTWFKACLAFKRSGDPRHQELYEKCLTDLSKAAKEGIKIGRTTYSLEKLRLELERPVSLLVTSAVVGEWQMWGGNAARTAVVDGGPPFLDPVFRTSLFYQGDDEANLYIKGELDKLFARDGKVTPKGFIPLPGTFPITTSDVLVFRGYDGVYGVATKDRVVGGGVVRAGDILWRSKTTAGLHNLLSAEATDDTDMKDDVKRWWGTYSSRNVNVSSIFYENPLIGMLAHDGQYAYFVDDVAITPPPVINQPEFGIVGGPQFRQSGDLADMVRAGRLAAVDIRTGNLKWELGRVKPHPDAPPLPPRLNEEEADKTNDAFRLCLDAVFLGAPLPLNGKLYVLIEQAGCIRLLCLDPKNLVQVPGQTRKPALVWSQKLGKPNTTLPADSVRRYQGANLAASEGIIVCPTNCGVVIGVDIMSRSLLWAHAYRKLEASTRPRQPRFDPNTGMPIIDPQLPNERWRSGGPLISQGRVILTAYDSNVLECLDLRTGKLLWSVPRDANDLYVGGVANGRVIVVGKNTVKAYQLFNEDKSTQRPRLAWETPLSAGTGAVTPTGHGALSRDAYYLPVRQESAGKDSSIPAGEIWAISLETGQITSKTAARKRNDTAEVAKFGIGNLVFQDGMVYAQSPWEVACYPQLQLKIAEMDRRLKENPNDPLGLLARGELRLDDGKLKEAIADFKAAVRNNLPPEKEPLLREKLYIAYTELLRADFEAGEEFLAEYEALCEVPPSPNETPEDRIRREDETKRRKRLHYYLLARGREKQGRLSEAFDHYLALANLGESKQLLDTPDEPNVKMRPDVWARGRIESMIRRASSPQARQALEVRVNREWEKVKDSKNLQQLREFVAVFGPYFDSGREAQFQLADLLLATNNDADAREAQMHLAQLRVSAEDVRIRARATEALAQLMIKNRMMEDAVAMYLQLGKEFPNVIVRDGKTGADFLTNLLTDKRLLPYLEPTRYPMPTRMRAEERRGNQPGINYGAQFEVESPRDLFPMYRQYRFVLDQFSSGNGTWSLLGYDRNTQSVRFRFSNMISPNLYNNQGKPIPYSQFVQGAGHLVLVQLGVNVYCFDLAEKRELWQRNLLGDHTGDVNPNFRQNPPVDIAADGTCTIRFPDGYTMFLGRSAVVQPNYIALLTRDGLECVEPQTRRILWTRSGIADRTQIHGDGRYIVLLETDTANRVTSTKLLRAADGMVVENSPDSGRILAEAASYQLHGRFALLTSSPTSNPRVLRLYDLATGQDVWKKEAPEKSVVITSPLNSEWTGLLKADGTAEIYAVRTGELVTTLKIDEKNVADHVKPCVGAQLLADADKYYLILDRDPNAPAANGNRAVPVYNNVMLRSQKVHGPIYAFDRATQKRLWMYADLLDHQWIVLEQFADLPVIIAAAPVITPNNVYNYAVVVIEKDRGRIIFNKMLQNNGLFMNMTVDHKNGTISLNRYDTRVVIQPDETKK